MKKNKVFKKLLSFKISIFLFSLFVIFILVLLNISVANPTSWPFYNIRRLYEKTQLSLKSSPSGKLHYQYKLLDNRLEDLSFVTGNGASHYVLSTSLRYSTTLGQITDLVIKNNMVDEVPTAKEKFTAQLTIIKNLIDKYPKDDSEFKYIVDDENYLKIYVNKLSSL